MLNGLRSAANNIFFKAGLIIIVFSFILWGVGDVIRGRNDFDIVKFSKLENIALSSFYNLKQQVVKYLEQNSEEKITDEKLEAMNIDRQILSDLISRRMFEAWINSANIAISDKIVARNIKANSQFQDDKGNFNLEIFKRHISNLTISEEEFYDNFKFQFAKDILMSSTKKFITLPNLMEDILASYIAQVKRTEYIIVDLLEKNNLEIPPYSEDDLVKFYQENGNSFKKPEERSVNYIIIPVANKNGGEEAAKELADMARKLEDEVAAGSYIVEIATSHKATVKSANGNFEALMKDPVLAPHAEQIFAMESGEVSYPYELKNNQGLILFAISKINNSSIPELTGVKQEVVKAYNRKAIIEANIQKLKEFESKVTFENFEDLAKEFNLNIKTQDFERAIPNAQISNEVREAILETNLGSVSSLIIIEDNAYIAKVTKIFTDKKQAETIKNNNHKKIKDEFRGSFLEEIIEYFYSRNIPDVKIELLGGKP